MLRLISVLLSHCLVSSQSLDRVFGDVVPLPALADRGASATYLDVRKQCRYPLEVLILQESIASFEDDFIEMQRTQLPALTSSLSASHPNSTFSVAFFTDKPLAPYGQPDDFCHRFSALTSDVDSLIAMYAAQKAAGGGDELQNNLGALLAAAESRDIGWGTNEVATKLIVHITDSAPHFYDGSHTAGLKKPTGHFRGDRAAKQCLEEYYPSPTQSKAALEKLPNLYVAHLIYDPEYLQGEVAKSWTWLNRYFGQTDDFVNLREQDSSDLELKLKPIVAKIDEAECRPNRAVSLQSTETGCRTGSSYCKEGVTVQLGFKPDLFEVEVRP